MRFVEKHTTECANQIDGPHDSNTLKVDCVVLARAPFVVELPIAFERGKKPLQPLLEICHGQKLLGLHGRLLIGRLYDRGNDIFVLSGYQAEGHHDLVIDVCAAVENRMTGLAPVHDLEVLNHNPVANLLEGSRDDRYTVVH